MMAARAKIPIVNARDSSYINPAKELIWKIRIENCTLGTTLLDLQAYNEG